MPIIRILDFDFLNLEGSAFAFGAAWCGHSYFGVVCGKRVATPNDPKLSDCEAGQDACVAGSAGAGSMTSVAVRCSAWLGHLGFIMDPFRVSEKRCRKFGTDPVTLSNAVQDYRKKREERGVPGWPSGLEVGHYPDELVEHVLPNSQWMENLDRVAEQRLQQCLDHVGPPDFQLLAAHLEELWKESRPSQYRQSL